MGTLLYGTGSTTIHFEDRALYHLQIVITAKLRRNEGFVMSWSDPVPDGGGRNTIWLAPAIMLHYHYVGSRIPSVNRDWVEQLMVTANSPGGLIFAGEPASTAP